MNRERVILNEEQIQKLITGLEDMVRDLRQKVNQLETNRDEAIKYIQQHYPVCAGGELLSLLERGKEC